MTTTIKKQIDKQTQKFIKAGCPKLRWDSSVQKTYRRGDSPDSMMNLQSMNREQRRHPKKFL